MFTDDAETVTLEYADEMFPRERDDSWHTGALRERERGSLETDELRGFPLPAVLTVSRLTEDGVERAGALHLLQEERHRLLERVAGGIW